MRVLLLACVFLSAAVPASAQAYEYDGEGRVSRVTHAPNQVVVYRYDRAGSLCYSGPESTAIICDADGGVLVDAGTAIPDAGTAIPDAGTDIPDAGTDSDERPGDGPQADESSGDCACSESAVNPKPPGFAAMLVVLGILIVLRRKAAVGVAALALAITAPPVGAQETDFVIYDAWRLHNRVGNGIIQDGTALAQVFWVEEDGTARGMTDINNYTEIVWTLDNVKTISAPGEGDGWDYSGAGYTGAGCGIVSNGGAVIEYRTQLQIDEGFDCTIWGTNSSERFVGSLTRPGSTRQRAMISTGPGAFSELPEPPGALGSVAYDINESGQIVGAIDGRPAFWDNNGVVILETDADPGDALDVTLGEALSINDQGHIVGWVSTDYVYKSGALWLREDAYGLRGAPDFAVYDGFGTSAEKITNSGYIGGWSLILNSTLHPQHLVGRLWVPFVPVEPPTFLQTIAQDNFAVTHGDPFSPATGEVYVQEPPELVLPGPMKVEYSRYYSISLDTVTRRSSPLGPNWRHNFEWFLRHGENDLTVVTDRGKLIRFVAEAGGTYALTGGHQERYQLRIDVDGVRFFDPSSNLIRVFDHEVGADGTSRLDAVEDGRGNVHTLTYNPGGQLVEVSNGAGRSLTFTYYDASEQYIPGRLQMVSDGTHVAEHRYYDSSFGVREGQPLDFVTFYVPSSSDLTADVVFYSYDLATALEPKVAWLWGSFKGYDGDWFTLWEKDAIGRVIETWNGANDELYTSVTYGDGTTTVSEPNRAPVTYTHVDGKVTAIDRGTDSLQLTADQDNLPTGFQHGAGPVRTNTWNECGRRSNVEWEDGSAVELVWVERAHAGFTTCDLAEVRYQDGTAAAFTWDATGNLLSVSDRQGRVHEYTYSEVGQMLTSDNGVGTTSYGYDALGSLTSITDPAGRVTGFAYDAFGKLMERTNPDGSAFTYTRDELGRVIGTQDERGATVTYALDEGSGVVDSVTDERGAVRTFWYQFGYLPYDITSPLGGTTTWTYDETMQITSITSATGEETAFTHDLLGNVASTTDARGSFSFTYDYRGRQLTRTDPLGGTTSYTRDPLGRVLSVTTAGGAVIDYTYTPIGWLQSWTDGRGGVTTLDWTATGELAGITSPGGAKLGYVFDAAANLSSVALPRGGTWTFTRDASGKLTAVTDPAGEQTSWLLDAAGRQSIGTLPGTLGDVTLTRDAGGLITRELYSDGTDLSYAYDAKGAFVGGTGVTLTRDIEGSITGANGLVFTRDAGGRLLTTTYAPGKTITYTWGPGDVVTRITDWLGRAVDLEYDAAGRLTTTTWPSGVTETRAYDADHRVTGVDVRDGATSLASVALERNATGLVTQASRNVPATVTDVEPTRVLGIHDAAQRAPGFTYDALGRRTAGDGRTYTWDGASRLVTVRGGAVDVDLTHDVWGRVTTARVGTTTLGVAWNDGLERPRPAVLRADGSDAAYVIHLPTGETLARVDAATDELIAVHADEVGNVMAMTDASGAVVRSFAYAPYGDVLAETGTLATPFRWQGAQGALDLGGGLVALGSRVYDVASAAFLSREPMPHLGDVERANPYAYARGNPLLFTDPTGHAPEADGVDIDGAPDFEWGKVALKAVDNIAGDRADRANGLAEEAELNGKLNGATAFGEAVAKNQKELAEDLEALGQLEKAGKLTELGTETASGNGAAAGEKFLQEWCEDQVKDAADEFTGGMAGRALDMGKAAQEARAKVKAVRAYQEKTQEGSMAAYDRRKKELFRSYYWDHTSSVSEYENLVRVNQESLDYSIQGGTESAVNGVWIYSLEGGVKMSLAAAGLAP